MTGEEQHNIETAIVPTIAGDLTPLAKDLAEIGVDSILEEGLLRNIPVVGVISALYNVQRTVRDRMYLKRMLEFLGPLSNASMEDRQSFVQKNLSTKKEQERFSETVVTLVDRADSSEKANLYGRFFLAHIQGEYEYEEVLKICSLIDRVFLPDLYKLPIFDDIRTDDSLLSDELYRNGFLSFAGVDGGSASADDGGLVYEINWYGRQVVRVLLQIKREQGGEGQ